MTEILKMRIKALLKAQARIRTAFFLCTIVATVLLIACFNLSLSWGRTGTLPVDTPDKSVNEAHKEEIKLWIDRRYYQVPLIGITIDISDDIAVIGPLTLLVFSFYYLSCTRAAFTQFKSLAEIFGNPTDVDPLFPGLVSSEMVLNAPDDGRGYPISPLTLYRALTYFPAMVALLAVCLDIKGNYWDRPYDNPSLTFWQLMSLSDRIKQICFDAFGFGCAILMFSYNFRASGYVRAFRDSIKSMTDTVSARKEIAKSAAAQT